MEALMSWDDRVRLERVNTYRMRIAVLIAVGMSGVIAALRLYDLNRVIEGGVMALMAALVYYVVLEDMHVDELHELYDRKAMLTVER